MSIVSATTARLWQPRARKAVVHKINVKNAKDTHTRFDLGPHEMLQLGGDSRWRLIICHSGAVWITQTHDLQDYVLEAGDLFLVTLPGAVLVQALGPAAVEVTPSLQKKPYRGSGGIFV